MHQIDDVADVVLGQRLEHDDLIQTVQELRTEMSHAAAFMTISCAS